MHFCASPALKHLQRHHQRVEQRCFLLVQIKIQEPAKILGELSRVEGDVLLLVDSSTLAGLFDDQRETRLAETKISLLRFVAYVAAMIFLFVPHTKPRSRCGYRTFSSVRGNAFCMATQSTDPPSYVTYSKTSASYWSVETL